MTLEGAGKFVAQAGPGTRLARLAIRPVTPVLQFVRVFIHQRLKVLMMTVVSVRRGNICIVALSSW